ncbi:MAG: F0F1 ATP synthase subunit delta [Syntrophothermus sp.]
MAAVARRYATALTQVAQAHNLLDQIEKELAGLVAKIEADAELQKVLIHPEITPQAKKEILIKLFQKEVSPYVLNLLQLLVDKDRLGHLREINAAYRTLANRIRRKMLVEVTTAQPLAPEDKAALVEKLSRASGWQVELQAQVDPAVLGGVRIRVGDRVIDGTVARQLELLKKQLSQARVQS